jgi:FdhD protein
MSEQTDAAPHSSEPGSVPFTYWAVQDGQVTAVPGGLIAEILFSIYVNGQDVATLMCSPVDQEALALGFLLNEGVIQAAADVRLARLNQDGNTIDVFLERAQFDAPRRLVLTSGCGGGISFRDLAATWPPLESDFHATPSVIFDRMRDLNQSARLYRQVRGVHTAVLGHKRGLLAVAEDIGRHNTIDKLAGKALLDGLDTRDCILVTSGRISSEMVGKARRMGVPLVASRTAPTSIAVQLAQTWGICVVGYVRRGGLRVYTHPLRLGLPALPQNAD